MTLTHPTGSLPDLEPKLTALAARLSTGGAWRPLVSRPSVGRSWSRLLDRPDVSAWLIAWAPGSGLGLHDHGEACAAITVVEGELQERYTDSQVSAFRQRDLVVGSTVSFGTDHVHEIVNRTGTTALSIHVYSPSLDRMTFYEGGRAGALAGS